MVFSCIRSPHIDALCFIEQKLCWEDRGFRWMKVSLRAYLGRTDEVCTDEGSGGFTKAEPCVIQFAQGERGVVLLVDPAST